MSINVLEPQDIYTEEVDRYNKRYYKNGKLHRDGDEPAVIWSDGSKHYYKSGKRHRDGDKPAVINSDGTIRYYKDGKLHRDGDKPADIDSDGSVEYWKNGELHRDGDKPASIWSDGTIRYYKNGVEYTKEQVEKMEEMRTRILNRIATHYARYWYDETYRDTEGEAFKARMMRDMDYLENEIGYKF